MMKSTYEDLYQTDETDIGFSASPRSEADIDKENDKAKPLAYRTKIKKGGSKIKKIKPPKIGDVDGGDGRVPALG